MPDDSTNATAALSQLCTDVTDVIKGYDVMIERGDEDLKPVAERLAALHETHGAALLTELEQMGGHPENTGSMMAAVHTAVATARDWFDKLDDSALPQIIEGEKRLIKSYDDAIKAAPNGHAIRPLLHDQRAAVQAQIDALERG